MIDKTTARHRSHNERWAGARLVFRGTTSIAAATAIEPTRPDLTVKAS